MIFLLLTSASSNNGVIDVIDLLEEPVPLLCIKTPNQIHGYDTQLIHVYVLKGSATKAAITDSGSSY
jgi:hypothetical protein